MAALCLLVPSLAVAEEEAVDSLPGSPRTELGLGMSPEAPPTPPAPGGRAPSFGAPADPAAWVFRLGGRFSAWGQLGLGREPAEPAPGASNRSALHTPPFVVGPSAFYSGSAATLNFAYGNQTVMASLSYEAALTASEYTGYHNAENGPRVRTAYVAVTPAPVGDMRLRFQIGAFPANYGAPGQWGWGTFGPVLAVHGYGGTAAADYALSPKTQLALEYGIAGVPEVEEAYVRGTYTDWPETGLSSVANHVHAGLSYENKYFAKLHLAHIDGRNLRTYLDDVEGTPEIERTSDGRIYVAALELRWVDDPYGQLGVTPVYWNFKNALSVHNGIWWGIDWTAGGREMSRKLLGPESDGTGQIAGVSIEYNFSVSRMLHYPTPFDGNGRDLRVALAFLPHRTLASQDPIFADAAGYRLGANLEYVLLPWLSATSILFGESRDDSMVDVSGAPQAGRFTAYNATLGLVLHSDWQSQDRMVLAYSRYFYSDFTDSNRQQPLDRDVFTLGASIAF